MPGRSDTTSRERAPPQSALVTVTREIDGTALVETSLTPTPSTLEYWTTPRTVSDVISDEIGHTVAALAIPAAAAGGVMLAQSQTALRVLGRITRLLVHRS